jgi:hypothetical protein
MEVGGWLYCTFTETLSLPYQGMMLSSAFNLRTKPDQIENARIERLRIALTFKSGS